jgi:AraC-like DNA-binding protein
MVVRSSANGGASKAEDPVAAVLRDLRATDSFHCHCELTAPWGLDVPARECASFHFVAEGSCYLHAVSGGSTLLEAHDFVLLPHGRGHVISDRPDRLAAPLYSLAYTMVGPNAATLKYGGPGARSVLVCGAARFDDPELHPILGLLPEVLHTRADEGSPRAMLAVLASEALSPGPGSSTVMTRLAEVVVVQTIRAWLRRSQDESSGWLRGLRDPQIGRSLASIHRRPEGDWTVALLAKQAKMSRSVFSERFNELVGTPPMQYLTRWRMHLAGVWLREGKMSLGEIAARLGYESEPSFSRAFKRHRGVPPGALRHAARAELARTEDVAATSA